MTDTKIALLSKRIEESGLKPSVFMVGVLKRDERTMRRWLAGVTNIPTIVIDFLMNPRKSPWP